MFKRDRPAPGPWRPRSGPRSPAGPASGSPAAARRRSARPPGCARWRPERAVRPHFASCPAPAGGHRCAASVAGAPRSRRP
eukprot:1553-Eustigmatos_ZCMA.PRE.1